MTSLYERMRNHGTLTEAPKEIPDSAFALPSTLNWMRAEAILVADCDITFRSAKTFYSRVQRKDLSERQLNSVFEQLLFSLNQIAALHSMALVPNKADVARMGIVTWYYGIYGAASAMIAAADGSFPDTHATTARQWDRQLVVSKLAMKPFNDRLSSLIPSIVDDELTEPRSRGDGSLTSVPATAKQAWGCHAEYLAGTAKWERGNLEQGVKDSKEFKELGVKDFRTKAARDLRDEVLGKRSISFLHEAARYRGKANYRDAIYLAYGKAVPTLAIEFVDNLTTVLTAFSAMAGAYCSARMGRERWQAFMDDLERGRAISLSPLKVWS